MAILGSAELWTDFFPDELIPDILVMVLEVWADFAKSNHNEHEFHITKRFRSALEQYKDLKRLPLRIDREVSIDDLGNASELGRVDLRLTHGYRSDVYFAFECKRVNVINEKGKLSSLATEYVENGMMRFIGMDAQYARTLHQGGMIAYVMDGNVKKAMGAINKKIKECQIKLQMTSHSSLSFSSNVKNDLLKETLHEFSDRSFTIHHVFLPNCDNPQQ